MAAKKKADPPRKLVAENRKARHNYFIEDSLEAGIMLQGSEVKSLRLGQANIAESYAEVKGGEMFLVNAYIPEYQQAGPFNHESRRPRKLLLHAREIAKMAESIKRGGMTMVPLKLYFNDRGIAKLELGLAKGKKLVDKRETEKARDWQRQKSRLLRERG
jgi:SsrA-binding protein